MKVLHVITSLGQGGAEAVLYRLVEASPGDISHIVVSLRDEAYYGPRLRALGVEVHALGMPRGRATLSGVFELRRLIVRAAPDVVQTWMYHADLLGGLVARWVGARAVVWGIHHANLDADKTRLSTRIALMSCAFISSGIPTSIACCSHRAAAFHQAYGYRPDKFALIPNGLDLAKFSVDVFARRSVREDMGIDVETWLLGMVARWHPHKDHANLLEALALLKAKVGNFRCLLVGTGMDTSNVALTGKIAKLGLEKQVILAGPRDDVPAVMNALDLHVLSSSSEAFPNAVAEAMACGTPCVVTDVGDAALIVGETGWVVPPRDALALSDAMASALAALATQGRDILGEMCRARVAAEFGLDRMVGAYAKLWREAVEAGSEREG